MLILHSRICLFCLALSWLFNPIVVAASELTDVTELMPLSDATTEIHHKVAPDEAYQLETFRLEPKSLAYLNVVADRFDSFSNRRLALSKLPELNITLITQNTISLPLRRGIQPIRHQYWEWMIEPGRVTVTDEQKQYVFPIALSERNANCTHNGLLVIHEKKQTLEATLQIAAETCAYLKFDLEYQFKVSRESSPVVNSISKQLIRDYLTDYQSEITNRQPVKPMTELVKEPHAFDSNDITIQGLVYDGVTYISDCDYRAGQYPFCSEMIIPSYSLAKSIVIGMAYSSLMAQDDQIGALTVSDWIPECGDRWRDVTLEQLVNMRTGFYDSDEYMMDESSASFWQFFLLQTAAQKISFACDHFPKRDSKQPPFVYHSSEHFLAGLMMQRYLQHQTANDTYRLYEDYLVNEVYQSLNLTRIAQFIKKTAGASAVPFSGWGLTMTLADFSKLANFINHNRSPSLAKHDREGALGYQDGFWLYQQKQPRPCQENPIIFMSGYGGISVVFAKEFTYFVFRDDERFNWLKPYNSLYDKLSTCKEP